MRILRWFFWVQTFIWIYFNIENMKKSKEYVKQLVPRLRRCGILGIKVGQYFSNRHEFLGRESCNELASTLLDNVPPHSMAHTQHILQRELAYFNHIDEIVLGSGSIAQVHSCTMKKKHGQEFVVKILHPNVQELHEDLDLFVFILPLLSMFTRFKIHWKDLIDSIRVQTDLRQEAFNMKTFRKKILHIKHITVPRVIFYNKSFLVMTKCAGYNLHKLCSKSIVMDLAATFLYTSMIYGTFHGDMHAGNVLIDDRNNISIIDFGICHKLPKGFVLQIFKLFHESCFEVIKDIMDIVSVSPLSHDIYMDAYEKWQVHDINSFKNAIEPIRILINILIKHNIVVCADVTLWLVQYTYLEHHVSFYAPLHYNFMLYVLQYMCEQTPFRVNNPDINNALYLLEKSNLKRTLLI